ncbi:hypothetical protein J6590_013908 [Homalodisca vitripennis]|nr:hypothetical protein J6590_013908 [Homalodisca vitripennis]
MEPDLDRCGASEATGPSAFGSSNAGNISFVDGDGIVLLRAGHKCSRSNYRPTMLFITQSEIPTNSGACAFPTDNLGMTFRPRPLILHITGH